MKVHEIQQPKKSKRWVFVIPLSTIRTPDPGVSILCRLVSFDLRVGKNS